MIYATAWKRLQIEDSYIPSIEAEASAALGYSQLRPKQVQTLQRASLLPTTTKRLLWPSGYVVVVDLGRMSSKPATRASCIR